MYVAVVHSQRVKESRRETVMFSLLEFIDLWKWNYLRLLSILRIYSVLYLLVKSSIAFLELVGKH